MKKPSPKKSPQYKPKLPRIAYHILGLLLILASIWLADIITGLIEKQKFMSLKQDMLSLQAEFNKIDQGWEYVEACNAQGGKFRSDLASSCGVYLENKNALSVERYINVMSKHDNYKQIKDNIYTSDGVNQREIIFTYMGDNIGCNFGGEVYRDKLIKSGMGCRGEAREFYFKKLL